MNKDRNYERRMVISKYSNRPPFDLKKCRDTYDIAEKIKDYPAEACRSCCKNRVETPEKSLTKSYQSMPEEDSYATTKSSAVKNVIPKIIETFQKLNPSVNVSNPTMHTNDSIQTLYRNSKTKLGKNLPRHKLMKSLLQNLDSDSSSKNKVSVRCKVKNKKMKRQFFNKDEIIRSDFNVNFVLNNRVKGSQDNNYTPPNCDCKKVDKKTSTTGLVWPPNSKEMIQYSSSSIIRNQLPQQNRVLCQCRQKGTSSLETIQEVTQKNEAPRFLSKSFLEEVPTKDIPQIEASIRDNFRSRRSENKKNPSQKLVEPIKQMPKLKSRMNVSTNRPSEAQSVKRCTNQPKDYSRLKEKTFVQVQVEKLDKVLRNSRNPNQAVGLIQKDLKFQSSPPSYFHKNVQQQKANTTKNQMTANYVGLMDKVRSNCPKYDSSDYNYDSDHGWSDTSAELFPQTISFPKETRAAVDKTLNEKRKRIPLSKFTKFNDNFRPALPQNTSQMLPEGYPEIIQHGDCRRPLPQRIDRTPSKDRTNHTPAHGKTKLNVPCKKNLLCDKGEQHSGSCGYTRNLNKVVF